MNPTSPSYPFNVLIVEDTDHLAALMLAALKRIRIGAHHVSTSEDAIMYLGERRPDLLLLDLNLAGSNGWAVLEYAKQKHGENGIPVIITTAYDDSMNRFIGKLQGVAYYLTKPFTPHQLISVVSDVLQLSKTQANI